MPDIPSNQKTKARVDVRMYNHGLGDCFLLAIRGEDDKTAFMLIDCGLHGLQANKRELFRQVLKDIRERTKGKDGKSVLDVVVGTHQHYDHLSGFHISGKNGKEFDDITIKELWLAWTENEGDAVARDFQLAQKKKEQAMLTALSKIGQAGFDADYAEKFKYLLGFVHNFEPESGGGGTTSLAADDDVLAADGTDSNEEALNFLREKVKKASGKIRYMEPPAVGFPGKEPGNKPIDIGIEGVRIYVLGPPKHNAEEYLGSMDPRQGEGFGEQEGEAHLLPEESAFLNALGIDSSSSGDSLFGTKKDYPFSKNYKIYDTPFSNHYLLAARLQQALKDDMGHLLRALLSYQLEQLGKVPLGDGLLAAIQQEEAPDKARFAMINRGLDYQMLLLLKRAVKRVLAKRPSHCYVEDYEPDDLDMPQLDEKALDDIFEKQLQNYLIGLTPWAANSMGAKSQHSLSFEDILKTLLNGWVKTAVKNLVGEILLGLQNQPDSLLKDLKEIFFKKPEESDDHDYYQKLEELYPTEDDKDSYIYFFINKMFSELLQEDSPMVNSLLFQSEAGYISSIGLRKRFKEDIEAMFANKEGATLQGEDDKVARLISSAILDGLAQKLKELGLNLKTQRRKASTDPGETDFFSQQDMNIFLKYLRHGLPTGLLKGLTPMDRVVLLYGNKASNWRQIGHDWLRAAESMALKLDSVRNNTSLVLAIELIQANKVLLFPGDAQAGNWRSWAEVEYELDEKKKAKAAELLAKTVFYKVGHHGSHNATLSKQGLDLMRTDELAAMIPVDQHVADKVGWEMPFAPLLEALLEKTGGKVAIADTKMDIGRLLEHLPKEQRTTALEQHLEGLKEKWEKAVSAFTSSAKKLTFSYKEKGSKKIIKEERPLYFEYRVE